MKSVSPKSVLADLRSYCKSGPPEAPAEMWVQSHEHELWVVAAPFAFRPDPVSAMAFEELWKECNLTWGECRFYASLAVTEVQGSAVAVASLIPPLSELQEVRPRTVAEGVLRQAVPGLEDELEWWKRADGTWITVSEPFASLVRKHAPEGTWHQAENPKGALVLIDGYGSPAGLLMPVDPGNSGVLVRDPDLPPQLFTL